jgi:hypothetical protein
MNMLERKVLETFVLKFKKWNIFIDWRNQVGLVGAMKTNA